MSPSIPEMILVIDDEPSLVRALARLLRRDGYRVGTAGNGARALEQLQALDYDVILCDLQMPELDGPTFYALLVCQYPALSRRVIFLTGESGSAPSMAAQALHHRHGAARHSARAARRLSAARLAAASSRVLIPPHGTSQPI
jgi:CheY-like chemotaxis protein